MELRELAELSTVVTGVVAVLALFGAVWQVRVGRRSQREATASALYADYLSHAMQNPRLASACIEVPQKDNSTEEFESYEWFVSLMLNACEQILDLTKGDKEWEATISAQLTYHSDYLLSDRFDRGYYSQGLFALLPRSRP